MKKFRDVEQKILLRKDLPSVIENLKKTNKKIVFTNGCFDILHWGHIYYLQEAAKLGDVLIVGINTDASIRRLKGENRPINKFSDRIKVVAALEVVDFVVGFKEDTPYKLILQIKPDILVKGGDWKIHNIVGAKEVMDWGGKVVTIPIRRGRSTTTIIEKILLTYEIKKEGDDV